MKRRQGFTLVELLVAMALIIFIMAILSQAFVAAMTTFRNLKGQGDMAEKLRAVTQLLQRDLAADHFEGKKRLSNPNFWSKGPPQQGFFQIWQGPPTTPAGTWLGTSPVTPGFVQNYVGNPVLGSTAEGADLSLLNSFRSINHFLAFTVKLRGNQMGDFFSAGGMMSTLSANFGPWEARYQTATSGGAYNYQWAAVEWFMQPQMNPVTGLQEQTITDSNPAAAAAASAQPIPLYTLRRRQALLVPDNSLVAPGQPATNIGAFNEMSTWTTGGNLYFNSPIDITVPSRRFWGGDPIYKASTLVPGSDIQLNDVVSFDVRMLVYNAANIPNVVTNVSNVNDPFVTLWQPPFNTLNTAGGWNNGNTLYFPTNPTGPMVFDTWTSLSDSINPGTYYTWNTAGQATSIPLWVGTSGPIILALQISIRIWDFKTNQTRQVTMVQAM